MTKQILTLQCKDRSGIVAAVATCLSNADCNIEEASQFNDPLSGQFFMRVVMMPLSKSALSLFSQNFEIIAKEFKIEWALNAQEKPVKTLILVSKTDHCLSDILYRTRTNHLNIDIAAIASNHDTNRALVEQRGIPYHHFPIQPDKKQEQESQIRDLISQSGAELIVMARYMQILSDEFCRDFAGRVINIHHSFLPGFKGARPYHQAYERGVKIIGATAHFATPDLDEGPIIEQDIVRIDHTQPPEKLQMMGRDTESRVLARAIDLYCQRRIFIQDQRTVIL